MSVGRAKSETQVLSSSQKLAEEMEAYCRIARINGALLPLKDLAELLSAHGTEEELKAKIANDPVLRSRFVAASGYVLPMSGARDSAQMGKSIEEEQRSADRARANFRVAGTFARLLGDKAILVAVSGTNSYLSARERDDIDLFCVTETSRLWIFMLRSYLLARIFRLTRRGVPPICFSFNLDEAEAWKEFGSTKNALYARDALMARVIRGEDFYRALLKRAGWMEEFFPALYDRRLSATGQGAKDLSPKQGTNVLNSFLFYTLGSYIELKSWLRNRGLEKEGRFEAIFQAKVSISFLDYASVRYRRLLGIYEALKRPASTPSVTPKAQASAPEGV